MQNRKQISRIISRISKENFNTTGKKSKIKHKAVQSFQEKRLWLYKKWIDAKATLEVLEEKEKKGISPFYGCPQDKIW